MSATINNLFNFSRSLPDPFDKLKSKKVSVSSKYGTGTEATLCTTVIKAINAICSCNSGKSEGAVGKIDHRYVAEYKSSLGADSFHIVVYDSNSGIVTASVYDRNTELVENYVLHSTGRDGAAVMMSLFPVLEEDAEFSGAFQVYYDEFINGFSDMNKATKAMAIMCDNAYRRIKDETCPAHVKVNIEASGNLMRVSQTQLDSGAFKPNSVLVGEFTIFAKTERVRKTLETIIEHEDFVGKYPLQSRELTEEEKKLVPKLPPWYIIPKEVVQICKHASATTGKPTQMRNFLLRGPAGTGKTMGAKAIAAGLGLPYMKYTCSAGTEIFDFIGQVFPVSNNGSETDPELEKERKLLESMGGITYANVAKHLHFPDFDDVEYAPVENYKKLTGIDDPTVTAQDCFAVIMERVMDKLKELSKPTDSGGAQKFCYQETDFLKALKYGYVVEIQEPTTILQPGVLVGLNSLLEQEGSITLPTGEIIERHPDAVVVVTTNVDYEGCRGMNQSILDRMSLISDVELPSNEVMTQRVMSVTGATDEYQVSQMVKVVSDMAKHCKTCGITDGTIGMRSLIDWVVSTEITGDPYMSALQTVVSKATVDEEERESLITTILEPIFAPKRKKI